LFVTSEHPRLQSPGRPRSGCARGASCCFPSEAWWGSSGCRTSPWRRSSWRWPPLPW